ncbi:DUF4275 family protein [Brevibacillus humidisoli]|uniref:DUF4275 family protein n=1 Tax=Brevibacillus humidisoli TaxID=2895522 RepID=UPI001E314904|nr:DUF4275 family protein [Brevibacillus humidisoli]UFJ40100.1 DUF4275 family protein [Brevibacillus humidisoli]
MTLQIKRMDSIKIVGVLCDKKTEVDQYCYQQLSINNTVDNDTVYKIHDEYYYMIGKQVSHVDGVEQGLKEITIPTGEYAVFPKEQISEIEQTDSYATIGYWFEVHHFQEGIKKRVDLYVPIKDYELRINLLPSLSREESLRLRKKYIRTFCNLEEQKKKSYYQDYLQGYGYLWDVLKSGFAVVCFEDVKYGMDLNQEVFFFWDGTSPFTYTMGRTYIFKMPFQELMNKLTDFPSDLYIFDSSLDWTVVSTHETLNEEGWNWLKIGDAKNAKFNIDRLNRPE